jgi:hypothetical protein
MKLSSISMESLDFAISCGQCFHEVGRQNGVVLSCGDFVCFKCSALITTCPTCGKERFKKITMSPDVSIPDEVSKNISNVTNELESVFNICSFQIRYYKRMIISMRQRNEELETMLSSKLQ